MWCRDVRREALGVIHRSEILRHITGVKQHLCLLAVVVVTGGSYMCDWLQATEHTHACKTGEV